MVLEHACILGWGAFLDQKKVLFNLLHQGIAGIKIYKF
jgi:hypothetical protein